ncbi:MAG: bifunctional glutamate N-acetyltransferase/amino-acid acetyltransferase ArgJ [Clostridia bacterium]
MNIQTIPGGVCAPKGFVAGGLHCGIRKNKDKKDLAVILCQVRCAAAAVYTRNKVFGAPITVTRENLQDGCARAVICNSGNANTCNADGPEKARRMCALVADTFCVDANDVIVASTGVIGQVLDIAPIASGVQNLVGTLAKEGAQDAAEAIMTTDTRVKQMAVTTLIGGVPVTLGAMAKGSGMIHPNMATMLSFITTDADITSAMLNKALGAVVDDTYNMVSVDGDTSTNDMVSIMASGLAGNAQIAEVGPDFDQFVQALKAIAVEMSRMIAADGEGATKLLECQVTHAPDVKTARTLARSVVMSSLVKAAMFGADANWGRILCAIGYADAEFEVSKVDVYLAGAKKRIKVCEDGCGVSFSEKEAKELLLEKEIDLLVDMKQGGAQATAWGCDLTYDYVKINGDYRT